MTKDGDIRKIVLADLSRKYKSDSDTMIIEELGLCQGDARIDIAVVNGAIHGLEIKSDKDTLKRLPNQIEIYSRSLDAVTLVVANRHLDKAMESIPNWWGVIAVFNYDNTLNLKVRRAGTNNPSIDPYSVVQLIWREEAFHALKNRGLHRGFVSKPKSVLWSRLVECLSTDELLGLVRQTLKSRVSWRSDQLPA